MHAAWDIYAQQLLHLGHGYPLWGPEPSQDFGEINIGDVGYFRDGYFCLLFNAMRSADDPLHSLRGVPDRFEVFTPPSSMLIRRPNHITQTQLHSKSLQSVSISTTGSVTGSQLGAAVSAGLHYQCSEESGALLMLKRPAHKAHLECKTHIQKYVRTNIASWCDFANDRFGIGLEEKDIIFVSGTTKTAVWAEAAFHNSSSSGELVIGGGCFVPSVAGEFRVSMSRSSDASVSCRTGPIDRTSNWKDDVPVEKYDQCIFLNYYKTKSRGLWRRLSVMRAAAGHDQLPHDSDDDFDNLRGQRQCSLDGSDDDTDAYDESCYDPVECLLDYILQHSDAEWASASDDELFSLFKGKTIPDDIRRALEVLSPPVIVDVHGCGTISIVPSVIVDFGSHICDVDSRTLNEAQQVASIISSVSSLGGLMNGSHDVQGSLAQPTIASLQADSRVQLPQMYCMNESHTVNQTLSSLYNAPQLASSILSAESLVTSQSGTSSIRRPPLPNHPILLSEPNATDVLVYLWPASYLTTVQTGRAHPWPGTSGISPPAVHRKSNQPMEQPDNTTFSWNRAPSSPLKGLEHSNPSRAAFNRESNSLEPSDHRKVPPPVSASYEKTCQTGHVLVGSAPLASSQTTYESILAIRKCNRISKPRNNNMWPPHLEVALMKGLEMYTPTESKSPRGLSRFPYRNKFIAEYIRKETADIRTAKQVGSRIQQLRDTSASTRNEVMKSIFNCHYEMMHPTNNATSSSLAPRPPPIENQHLSASPEVARRQTMRNDIMENLRRNIQWEQQVSRKNLIATGTRGAALRDPLLSPPLETTRNQQGDEDDDEAEVVRAQL